MVYLPGGPSHQDMVDLKMEAPAEIRGSFRPIATSVPGIEICEHLPRLAAMMEKFAIIRSLHGGLDQHCSDLCLSGYPIGPRGRQDGHPSLGASLSRLHGPVDRAVPPFVGLSIKTRHAPYGNPGLPAAAQLVPRNDGENPEWRKIETAWRETELHQTGNTFAPLDFNDFIPAADNPLSKASDGQPVGLEPEAVSLAKDGR
jgi:hypothetical protein